MKMTINKLPAVLLAVAMAAMIIMAEGPFVQSFADTDDYTVDIIPRELEYIALPGKTIELSASVYHDFDGDVYEDLGLEFKWTLSSDSVEFAKLKVDSKDLRKAKLVFKNMPSGVTEMDALVTVNVEAYMGGTKVASTSEQFEVDSDYYKLYSDFISTYQKIGTTQQYQANVIHFDMDNTDGEPVPVQTWEFEYDKEDPVVEITEVERTDTLLVFDIKRLKGDSEPIIMSAKYGDDEDDVAYAIIWMENVPTDLNEYKIILQDDLDESPLFIQDDMPITREYLDGHVLVNYDDKNLDLFPGTDVIIKVEKYNGYDEDTGDIDWVPHEGDLTVDPKGSPVNKNGEPTEGTATYRVYAVPAEGSVFTGETEDFCQYIFMYSDKSISGYAANVDFNDSYLTILDENPYSRYDVYPGTSLDPTVTLNGVELEEGTDYTPVYVDGDDEESNEFPETPGLYTFYAVGAGDYYGKTYEVAIKVGMDNTDFKASGKTIKVKIGKKKKTTKNKTFAKAKAFKVSGNKGTVTFKKSSGNKKIKVASNGKVTVKKGLKKGTYKIKVKVTDKESYEYFAVTKTVTMKVKVTK